MSKVFQNLSNRDSPEIKQVIDVLSKITSRSPEEIQPHLNELLERLTSKQDKDSSSLDSASFCETSNHEQWLVEFYRWIDSHENQNIPVLSEEAMSRESIYSDRW